MDLAEELKIKYLAMFREAGIAMNEREIKSLRPAILYPGRPDITLGCITYINTQRVCSRELALLPGQTFPEHRHPPHDDDPGKEETFRCRWGEVYIIVPGEPALDPKSSVPEGMESVLTARHEIVLKPGDQYTLKENTLHWFQAGPRGAIVSEFSSPAIDCLDIYTDPELEQKRQQMRIAKGYTADGKRQPAKKEPGA